MTWQDFKDRFLKYDTLHGLYKIPLGLLLLCLVFTNLPPWSVVFSKDIFQYRYLLIAIAAPFGCRYLMEGIYNLCHNPVKNAATLEVKKADLIARSNIVMTPATQPAPGQADASIPAK